MIIERMTTQTVSDAAQLERLCFSRPWSREALEAELNSSVAVYLVAIENGVVCGYAGMHSILGEGYITNVAVHPDHRRKGIATRLISALMENGLNLIALEVRESNLGARLLYGELGFKIAGRRKGFYEEPAEDALIMTKEF